VKARVPTSGKPRIVYQILAYLTEHPQAQDTLEGILEWWLPEEQSKSRTGQVKEALGVLEHTGRDGRVHYRMNRRRSGEIRGLLTEGPD